MTNYLYIAVLAVCFYDAVMLLLLPSSATFILGTDGSGPRLVCYMAAMAIILNCLICHGFKQLPNIWMGLLLGFIVFSSFHGPNLSFESLFCPKDPGLFNFKPLLECLLYFCLFMALVSMPISKEQRDLIFKALAYTGIIYAGYIVLQRFGLDQIYKLYDTNFNSMTRNPQAGGFLSQPVFAAALLAICMPFVFRLKRAWVGLIVLAVWLTGNRSALIAMALSGLYLFLGNRKWVLIIVCAYMAFLTLLLAIYFVHPNLNFHDTGRLGVWKQVILDFCHPLFPGIDKSYVLTGFGIGSFSVLFPFYHHSDFYQAHNEYLEVLYTTSFIGLFLFLRMMGHIFNRATNHFLFMALVAICVCAITNAVWHIAQLQFLTVFIVGLIYNQEEANVVGTKR